MIAAATSEATCERAPDDALSAVRESEPWSGIARMYGTAVFL